MAAAASGLGVGAGGSAAISNERLHDILSTVGVPMIELGFFPQDRVTRIQEQLCEHLPSKIINSLDDLTEASRARRSGFFNAFANSIDGKSVELSWDSTSTDNRKELLSYFASVSRSSALRFVKTWKGVKFGLTGTCIFFNNAQWSPESRGSLSSAGSAHLLRGARAAAGL